MDLRTVYPLDEETIMRVDREDVPRAGACTSRCEFLGIGSEVAAVIGEKAFEHLDAPIMRLAPPNHAGSVLPPLEDAFLPQVDDIAAAAEALRLVGAHHTRTSRGRGTTVAHPVTMPQLGETVIEGTIPKWLKYEGETIDRDEPLFEISTDKVDTEVPSPVAGTLVQIIVPEGETVSVGTSLAMIDDGDGSDGAVSPTAARGRGAGGGAGAGGRGAAGGTPAGERRCRPRRDAAGQALAAETGRRRAAPAGGGARQRRRRAQPDPVAARPPARGGAATSTCPR